MVTHPGTAARPHRLRPLAEPRRIHVEADGQGAPLAVMFEGVMQPVAAVQDRWRIDDEWWRGMPVARMYWQVQIQGGRVLTVFRDLIGGTWWTQRY